jgi:hypothetical protein
MAPCQIEPEPFVLETATGAALGIHSLVPYTKLALQQGINSPALSPAPVTTSEKPGPRNLVNSTGESWMLQYWELIRPE